MIVITTEVSELNWLLLLLDINNNKKYLQLASRLLILFTSIVVLLKLWWKFKLLLTYFWHPQNMDGNEICDHANILTNF